MNIISCAICGSTNSKKLLTSHDKYIRVDNTKFTLVRCSVCELVYLNPQPTMEELVKYYPSHYPSYLPEYKVLEENRLLAFLKGIKKLITPPSSSASSPNETSSDTSRLRVLDFGCGSGRFLLSMRLAHPLWELHGFDISTNKEIKSIGHDVSIILDAPDTIGSYFEHESFDRIYLNNVLEHVNDPVATLRMLTTLLRLDGEMVIEVPNIDSIKFKIFRSNFFPLEIPRHLYHFSPLTLSKLCRKCGLSIIEVHKIGSAKGTVRSLYYALGIHKDKIDPLLLLVIDKMSKLLGEKWINDDSMIARVKKAAPNQSDAQKDVLSTHRDEGTFS